MALRTLMARVVRTSAAALRLQTPALGLSPLPGGRANFHSAAAATRRLSPPAGGRPCLIPIRNLHTRIDLESASMEELEREATFLEEQIKDCMNRMLKEKDRSDLIMKDLWVSLKRIACCAAVVKVITFVISPDKLAEEAEVMN